MALGIDTGPADGEGGASFMPILKYKATSGRLYLVQRTQDSRGEWVSSDEDITRKEPEFAADFGSIEVGWFDFGTGGAPVKVCVPVGQPLPPRPDAKRENAQGKMTYAFSAGFRLKCAGRDLKSPDGQYVREFSSNAKTVTKAIDDLHTAFEAAPEAARGLIPVVKFVDAKEATIETPKGKLTFYAPVFEIVKWVERSVDVLGPRTVPPPAARAPVQQAAPRPQADDRLSDDIPF